MDQSITFGLGLEKVDVKEEREEVTPTRKGGKKEMSAREKALQFAKNNIPKPKPKKDKEVDPKISKIVTDKNDPANNIKSDTDIMTSSPQKDEFSKLNANHN